MVTPTERTRIWNHPERAVPEETAQILSDGMVAHVGFIQEDMPYVIPLSYHYDQNTPEALYLHGSVRSRAMKLLATGATVCVTVTLTDGLVYSRKAMTHSMNYRSAVVFGTAREVTDDSDKSEIFDDMVQRYLRPACLRDRSTSGGGFRQSLTIEHAIHRLLRVGASGVA